MTSAKVSLRLLIVEVFFWVWNEGWTNLCCEEEREILSEKDLVSNCAWEKEGTLSISFADGLFAGSLVRQTAIKSLNSLEYFFPFSATGGGEEGIRYSARRGWKSERGGFRSTISIAVIPRAQTSDCNIVQKGQYYLQL